uniref:Uncharacterized protein n=1 Tax=Panagrolaimus sp. PS1159 TaxID=55785 RepID=A0AC35GJ07_9BILA
MGFKRGKSTFFEATVRTLLMMIGEYDYRESIKEKATLLIQLLICLFLMVMTIFLMNLLIGLAVSDTTATLEKALRLRIKLQIETIHHIEIDMPETLRRHFWRGFRITKKTIGDYYEEDNTIGSFRQLFRWFGLSKDALKKEIPLNQLSDTNNNASFDIESRLQKNSENISKKCDSLVNKQNNLLKITERLEENVHQITDERKQNGTLTGKYISKIDIGFN